VKVDRRIPAINFDFIRHRESSVARVRRLLPLGLDSRPYLSRKK
jgi:hypothetical protein